MTTKFLRLKLMMVAAIITISTSLMAQLPKVNVNANITTNTTWTSNKIWFLRNKIYVTNGATLTIQPGTVIIGDTIKKGTLIITRGAKIQAVGTPCQPIVFTSSKAVGNRVRGDWGGVILLGNAHTNSPGDTNHIEGIEPIPNTLYGGGTNPNDADNSGTMQYVRIEFAGVALSPNNEINGLTFGAVGSGTTIDHIQVSFSNDDSYEWFGGTVNTKYLIALRGIDDDFDTDQGYSGKNQFLVGLRDPKVADVSGSKGFESDNDATGSTNLPQTRAIFSNVDVIAGGDTTANPLFVAAAHIRRNSHLYIYNSILEGYPAGVLIDGSTTEDNVAADTLFASNIVTCKYAPKYLQFTPEGSVATSDSLLLRTFTRAGNKFYQKNSTGPKLQSPYNLKGPKFWPMTGSFANGNANFNHVGLNDPFFTNVGYIGAFSKDSTEDWTKIWANWDPINTDYRFGVPNKCGKPATEEQSVPAVTADVLVSPNPSTGSFSLALKGFNIAKIDVKIADLNTGKIYFVGKADNNSTTRVNVNVPNGNYVVEITDGKNIVSRKITILK